MLSAFRFAYASTREPKSVRPKPPKSRRLSRENVNFGVHFRTQRAVLSGAISIPTVGPRPWAVEAIGYLNYLF